jgi:hypothetical protein
MRRCAGVLDRRALGLTTEPPAERLVRRLRRRCDDCGRLVGVLELELDVADPGDPRPFVMVVCRSCHCERVVRRRATAWGSEGRSEAEVLALVDGVDDALSVSGSAEYLPRGRRCGVDGS